MSMLTFFLLCASALAFVSCIEKPYYALEDAASHFATFMKTYNKHYARRSEKRARFEIFKSNLERVNRMNADPNQPHAVFGISPFSDLTEKEFESRYNNCLVKSNVNSGCRVVNNSLPLRPGAPDSFDWRKQGVITPVKDQGGCGSCWAFSTTGGLEAAYAIKNKKLISLSEQQLVDCDRGNGNMGCGGGDPDVALQYFQKKGAMGEDDYPYKGVEGSCKYNPSSVKVKVVGQTPVDLHDEDKARQIVSQTGPISIGIAAGGAFQMYTSGILNCPTGEVGHAVLLVGYGSENGLKYWLIKNSWGSSWGESGYIRVKAGNNPCSMYDYKGVIPQTA